MESNTFPMVAKTFQGLEDVLRDELIALGAKNVEIGLRMVSFEGDKEMMYRANFCCRTAVSILKPIVKFTAANPDELYDAVRDIDWSKYIPAKATFSIDATVNSADFPHSKYVVYRVKDGIADHFFDSTGSRPSIRLSGADIRLNVHISDQRVTISLNSSGEPLNQRGYRVAQTEAPINEVLAAGIILKTGWRGDTNFVDPMCGSGTFLIEAGLIARNIAPGIFRSHFAFEAWPDFDAELLRNIYDDDSAERDFEFKIYGGDIDPEAIAASRRNIRQAGLESTIELSCRPFADWADAPQPGILITNPPYGERLKPDDMSALYRSIGTTLKQQFKGYHAWVLGYRDEHFANIGLKPSVKFPILNGNLECSLREYVLFEGSLADFKTAGGSTTNEDFNREARPKVQRRSDRQWKEEAAKFDGKSRPSRSERRPDGKRHADGKRPDGKRFGGKPGDKKRFDGKRADSKGSGSKPTAPRRFKPAVIVPDKGPRILADKATVFSPVPIRSRRGWRKTAESDSDSES